MFGAVMTAILAYPLFWLFDTARPRWPRSRFC
jgi:hypothetical protein